jgi:crotonobetainyl-CoA:carnitine CoA-transferase CaiB-like acyl-CoA transferase
MPSDEAAVEALRDARLPSAPVLTVEKAMRHPHLVERQTVQTVHDRILGEFQIPGFPLRFSSFPERLDLEAPFLGEHNQRILSSYLGYSSHRIARLEQEGVLRSLPH